MPDVAPEVIAMNAQGRLGLALAVLLVGLPAVSRCGSDEEPRLDVVDVPEPTPG